jgi:hypothetical protein
MNTSDCEETYLERKCGREYNSFEERRWYVQEHKKREIKF